MVMQVRRTLSVGATPTGLAEGQLSVGMADTPPTLWAGVPTGVDPTGIVQLIPGGALLKSGGTMTGPLLLSQDATDPMGAATFQQVGFAESPAMRNVGRNYVVNGRFWTQRRGYGPFVGSIPVADNWWQSSTPTGTLSTSLLTATPAQRLAIGDQTCAFVLRATTTGTAGAASAQYLYQGIEDLFRLGGKTVVVSFWAWSQAGTPRIGVNLEGVYGDLVATANRVSVPGQSIQITTTPTRYSFVFNTPSVEANAIPAWQAGFLYLNIWFAAGANNNTASGTVGLQNTSINLWGIQLERGSAVSPLETVNPAWETALAARFLINGRLYIEAQAPTGAYIGSSLALTPQMFTGPTITPGVVNRTNVNPVVFEAGTTYVLGYAQVVNGAVGASFEANFTAEINL